VPLSQSTLLDVYPREKHGSAMALWGMGVMVGPILGPPLGGWLTDAYSWHWVFLINVPVGALALFGVAASLPTDDTRASRFDWRGFAFLAIGIGALQLMLDRGDARLVPSGEIVFEAIRGARVLSLPVHTLTSRQPFLDPELFRDRNFSVGLIFIFLSASCCSPPWRSAAVPAGPAGYPVIDVGFLLVPRGVGTMLAMLAVGRLAGRIDARVLITFGLALTALSLWQMTGFTLDSGGADIVRTGAIQGIGLGFIFVPLSTLAFSTLAPRFRNEGTAMFSLVRNLGSSIGISVVISYLASRTQANHAAFASYIQPSNLALRHAVESGLVSLASPAGLAAVDAAVTRQAATLAYLQDFRLMMWISLAALPLVLLLRKQAAAPAVGHAVLE
jgi:DHA2 family multidrug resistance protein